MNNTDHVGDVFLFEVGINNYVYAPLDKKLLKINDACYADLQSNQTEKHWTDVLDPSGDLGIFNGEKPKVKDYVSLGRYDGLVLLVSNACNLKCKYCYAKKAQKKTSYMKENQWGRYLDDFFLKLDSDSEEIGLAFHGYGECTLFPEEIIKITEEFVLRCEKINKKVKLQITTNGTFDLVFCDFLIENNFFINLSLDGDSVINDTNRIANNGRGSYSLIEGNIKRITASRCRKNLLVRATVTVETVSEMLSSFKHFHQMGIRLVHIEPVYIRGAATSINHDPSYLFETYEEQYKKCVEFGNKHDMKLYYGPVNFGVGTRFCSHEKKLMIDHEGRLVSCVEAGSGAGLDEFKYGAYNADNEIVIESSKVNRLNQRNVEWYPECNSCILKYHCAGNCPASRIGDSWGQDTQEQTCSHSESIFKWVLDRICAGDNVSSVVDFPVHRIW